MSRPRIIGARRRAHRGSINDKNLQARLRALQPHDPEEQGEARQAGQGGEQEERGPAELVGEKAAPEADRKLAPNAASEVRSAYWVAVKATLHSPER